MVPCTEFTLLCAGREFDACLPISWVRKGRKEYIGSAKAGNQNKGRDAQLFTTTPQWGSLQQACNCEIAQSISRRGSQPSWKIAITRI